MEDSKNSKLKPSYKYAIVSISIVLYFLGLYMILYLLAGKIDQQVREQVNIVVELRDSISTFESAQLVDYLRDQQGIIPTSITQHASDQAYELLGYDIDEYEEYSAFREMITFRVQAEYYRDEYLDDLKFRILERLEANAVYYESDADMGIEPFIRRISLIFLVLSIIFTILALIIIHNTLSLSLYADRWEIKTMELVGARKPFIRGPYVAEGRIMGQKAFLIAAIAIILTIIIGGLSNDFLAAVTYWPYVGLTLVLLLLLSTLITMISTFTVVNKFLDQNLKDLYE